jgi:hypothetical protein
MNRITAIGYLLITTALIPAITLLLAYSLLAEQKSENIKIVYKGNVWNHVNAILEKGCVVLFNQAEVDSSGDVTPWIESNPQYATPPRGRRGGQIILPGCAVHYGEITREGDVAWSLRLSLLIPLVMSLVIAGVILRRIRKHQARPARSTPRVATSP